MAVERLLILLVTGFLANPVAAQELTVQQQRVPVPRWVRVSVASHGVSRLVNQGANAVESSSRVHPLATAIQVGDTLYTARQVFVNNRRLLGSRSKGVPVPRIGPILALAGPAYDLSTGNLSASQAGQAAIVTGASSAAAGATYAGMMAIASTFGTASTGTAIGTLSGATFTNAAFAWWGGGAVAAGGGGMAIGTVVVTGGMIVVAAAATYGVYKVWNILDPAERDAMQMLTEGLLNQQDLTDTSTVPGARLLAEKRSLDQAVR